MYLTGAEDQSRVDSARRNALFLWYSFLVRHLGHGKGTSLRPGWLCMSVYVEAYEEYTKTEKRKPALNPAEKLMRRTTPEQRIDSVAAELELILACAAGPRNRYHPPCWGALEQLAFRYCSEENGWILVSLRFAHRSSRSPVLLHSQPPMFLIPSLLAQNSGPTSGTQVLCTRLLSRATWSYLQVMS